MQLLGDLLAEARDSAGAFQAWLDRSNPELAGKIENAAAGQGMTPAGYVRMALSDFNRFASEEDWATLTSSLRSAGDPGTTCLLAVAHWRLTVRGCGEQCAGNSAQAGGRS